MFLWGETPTLHVLQTIRQYEFNMNEISPALQEIKPCLCLLRFRRFVQLLDGFASICTSPPPPPLPSRDPPPVSALHNLPVLLVWELGSGFLERAKRFDRNRHRINKVELNCAAFIIITRAVFRQ